MVCLGHALVVLANCERALEIVGWMGAVSAPGVGGRFFLPPAAVRLLEAVPG